ncbi:putative F-box/FBD/LRR-repeat protein At1g78840 isoform X2 [Corylus avellana]|uniref:putative F-box/FBD/LRR-repeat protein At1g78840 isoform X2 n=1 Tax=Corylus avellana TaxID=13451 RepID=UPI00286AD6B7|nr:putative F-box/FBD/LRR-repeat protein At1g78840 isoform X2 [Corylus avellana]
MMLKRVLQKSVKKKLSSREEKRDPITVDERTIPMDLVSHAPSVRRKRKRKGFNTIDESVRLRKKQNGEDLNILDQTVESMDQISQLPGHIIHYILSLLHNAKDAARTSILSKRWRDIWTSLSILKFDQRKIQEQEGYLDTRNKEKAFKDFVDNSLKSHLQRKLSIHKLVLYITSCDLELARNLDRWINVAIENNMKELDLHVVGKVLFYSLPQTIFAATTMTGLRLCGCGLLSLGDIKLPQLQKLYLRDLFVDQQTIEDLISSCPLIEDLRFIRCTGLKDLQVSGLLKLDRFEVHLCHEPKNIEVKVPNLQTFWYCGKKSTPCQIDLVACVRLKSLTLVDANMTDEMFQDLFASFPLLDKLDLSKCNKLKNITISSIRLKRLALRGCTNLIEADIDTPNLSSFEYKGNKMPISFPNPLCLKEAKLSFDPVYRASNELRLEKADVLWFGRLREFLSKFNNCNGLKLVVHSKKIEIIRQSMSFEDLLDHLLRTWHPETLSIVSSSSSREFPELVYRKIMDREENPSCCSYNTQKNKCWRHFLKDIKIENFEAAAIRRASDCITWLKSSPTMLSRTTSFGLRWDDRHS